MARTTLDIEIAPADAQIRRIAEQLGAEAPKAATRALNRVLGMVQTRVVRALAAESGLLSSRVRKSVTLRRATFDHLLAVLSVTGRRIPLLAFKARQVRAGVSVSGGRGRGRTVVAHAFIATMKSGHRGVFMRGGKSRLPIHKQFGPSLPEVAERIGIMRTEHPNVEALLRQQFESEARFILTGQRRAPGAESAA